MTVTATTPTTTGRRLMEGSEAIAEAAIAAGCRFFAGYPMTPFTEVLEYFAAKLRAEKQKADVVKKVQEKTGDFILLDTRSRQAFEQGHIEGAWCLPLEDIGTFAARAACGYFVLVPFFFPST